MQHVLHMIGQERFPAISSCWQAFSAVFALNRLQFMGVGHVSSMHKTGGGRRCPTRDFGVHKRHSGETAGQGTYDLPIPSSYARFN